MPLFIDVQKFLDKNIIYEFHVEAQSFDLNGQQILTDKWLQCFDWLQIYDKLQNYLDECKNDVEHIEKISNRSFYISCCIEVIITVIPFKSYYRKLLNMDNYDTTIIDKVLQIKIRKINLKGILETIRTLENNSIKSNTEPENTLETKIKKEISCPKKEVIVKKNRLHEYDPVKVGNGIPNDLPLVPYKPSKVICDNLNKSTVEDDPYSPQPLEKNTLGQYKNEMKYNPINLNSFENISNKEKKFVTTIRNKEKSLIDDVLPQTSSLSTFERTKYNLSSTIQDSNKYLESTRTDRKIKQKKYKENSNQSLFGSDNESESEKFYNSGSSPKQKDIEKHNSKRKYNDNNDDKIRLSSKKQITSVLLPSASTSISSSSKKKSSSKVLDTKRDSVTDNTETDLSKWLTKSKSDKNELSSSHSLSTRSTFKSERSKDSDKSSKISGKYNKDKLKNS